MKYNKTVLVLPCSKWQLPLIKRLKERKYRLVLVHPTPDVSTIEFADVFERSDILDIKNCLSIAKRHNVDVVISDQSDIATRTIAYISEELGIPSQTQAIAELFTDKILMRQFCKDNKLKYPEYKQCRTEEEAIEFFKTIGKKAIMKPLDANSSRGVYTINSVSQIKKHFNDSQRYSRKNTNVILERFIEGPEFSVDGIKTPSKHVSLMVGEKQHFSYNQNLDAQIVFSRTHEKYDYGELMALNDRIMHLSKLPFGLTHAEYKYENGQLYLIEMGARGGGNLLSSHIVPIISGIDNYNVLIDLFSGIYEEKTIEVSNEFTERKAVLKYFDLEDRETGIIKEIKGVKYLEEEPKILHFDFNFKAGELIKRPTDGGNRIGYYIAYESDEKKLNALIQRISKQVEFIYV